MKLEFEVLWVSSSPADFEIIFKSLLFYSSRIMFSNFSIDMKDRKKRDFFSSFSSAFAFLFLLTE